MKNPPPCSGVEFCEQEGMEAQMQTRVSASQEGRNKRKFSQFSECAHGEEARRVVPTPSPGSCLQSMGAGAKCSLDKG